MKNNFKKKKKQKFLLAWQASSSLLSSEMEADLELEAETEADLELDAEAVNCGGKARIQADTFMVPHLTRFSQY